MQTKNMQQKQQTHWTVFDIGELERMVEYAKKNSSKNSVKNKTATIVLNFRQVSENGHLWITDEQERRLREVSKDDN